MSHFAEINADNIVQRVIVAEQDFINSGAVGDSINWIQTSYNTIGGKHYDQDGNEDSIAPLRKNYAGAGYTYDSDKDAFYSPTPYPSWTLNDTTCIWEPPVAYPSDGKRYEWNEETTAWDLME
jgi:hypothetical protein